MKYFFSLFLSSKGRVLGHTGIIVPIAPNRIGNDPAMNWKLPRFVLLVDVFLQKTNRSMKTNTKFLKEFKISKEINSQTFKENSSFKRKMILNK